MRKINSVERELDNYLEKIRVSCGLARGALAYNHSKTAYAIEVSVGTFQAKTTNKKAEGKDASKGGKAQLPSLPDDFLYDSQANKGKLVRYTTKTSQSLAKQLEDLKSIRKATLVGFCCFVFEFMVSKRPVFDAFVQIITEIDVLICLKEISFGGST